MSEIYLKYNGGFSRVSDKSALSGSILAYSDFKNVSADIKAGQEYGIILDANDIDDFVANYEDESVVK
ncbi:MAG: hypothetical protein GX677_02175 [Treponema sp.]|nr:hypothetical protein [Treponema sp.]